MHESRKMTARRFIAGAVFLVAPVVAPSHADILWDNGNTNGEGAISNATEDVFGFRRTVLDDFVVPEGVVWQLTGFRHLHHWQSLDPPQGKGMQILLRADEGDAPGAPLQQLTMTSYEEQPTGRVVFGRLEAESWVTFEPVDLAPGHYWFEGTIVGPDDNRWLTGFEDALNECWVNWEDLGGLQPGSDQFGVERHLNFRLYGTVRCRADLDGNGAVDFADVLAILSAWDNAGGPEDLDESGFVDFGDLLIVLASWGPCV